VLPRIEAVLFDAGGVLVLPDPITIGAVLAPFGGATDVATLTRAHYAGMRAQDLAAAAHVGTALEHHDWDNYRTAYARAAGVAEDDLLLAVERMEKVFSPFLWRYPLLEAVAALWNLHGDGVPMGVVSNASGQIEGTLATQGVCQVGRGAGVPVTCVVDSDVAGVAKPHPGVFAPAVEALGLPPDRVAYVGDSSFNDVAGARAAGLVPIHLDPYDDHPDADHQRIRSLHELRALVG
jgi:putative hydrolase of the HAD superfamily